MNAAFIYNGKRDTKPPDEGPARKEPAWQRRSEPASVGALRPTRARCWRRRRPAMPISASRCSSTPISIWCACPFPTIRCAPSTPTSFWTTTAPPPSWTWVSTTLTASRRSTTPWPPSAALGTRCKWCSPIRTPITRATSTAFGARACRCSRTFTRSRR